MDERDLSFQPVVNPNPEHLTREQIDFYNENGYICPISVFSEEEARRNREYLDALLAKLSALKDGRDTYAINCFHTRCEGIYDLVREPRILDYVEDIIGPNIVGWATHYFCKMPHDPKVVPWHQDASYWPLTPARTVTAWIAIDDADEENAAMQFLPGTHKLGPLDWKQTDKAAVLDQEIVGVERFGKPVFDTLKAGQMSLHADMLAHGSTPNTSDRRRCGLTIRYCPPEVRPLKDEWGHQAILCRGEITTPYWKHNERPVGDDLSRFPPKSIAGN